MHLFLPGTGRGTAPRRGVVEGQPRTLRVMLKATATTVARARRQRREMSLPEILLWRALKPRPSGLKFRKQHPVGVYTLDFFGVAVSLWVEVDGAAHDCGDQPAFDDARTAWLAIHGIETLRIPATAVLRELDGVIDQIVATARLRLPLRQPCGLPPPRTGEE